MGERKKFVWRKERRSRLEVLVKEGYSVAALCKKTKYSRYVMEKELKRGLTEEEWQEKRYVKYNKYKAVYNETKEYLGDNFELLLEAIGNKDEQ